jgi:magnesium transporter
MLRLHLYAAGQLTTEAGPQRLGPWPEGTRAWLEVVAPSDAERELLKTSLGLHELALEDAARTGIPPKLDDYGDHLFLIAHSAQRAAHGGTRKLALFLSKHWFVTIAREPLPLLDELVERVRREPAIYFPHPDQLAHAVLLRLLDGFEARVDEVMDSVEQLEDRALQGFAKDTAHALLDLRQQHATLLRTVRGQRDMVSQLARSTHPALSRRVQPYMRALADHTLRIYELLDDVRDNIAATRDAYLATINNRLSETMRVLTVIATIMMPLTLISGIFGMNFVHIPGLGAAWGFWATLGAMLVLAIAMLAWFDRRGWI